MLSLILALTLSAYTCKPMDLCVNDAFCKDFCPVKKVVKKKVVKKHVMKTQTVVVEKQPCCTAPVVNVTVVAQAQAGVLVEADPSYLAGIRGAGLMSLCGPKYLSLVGLRLNALPVHLGLDLYTEFGFGTGASLLVYPVQTGIVMWHLNGGVVSFFNESVYVTPDLPRNLDLTLGTGLEVRVFPHLWVTADYRLRMANAMAIKALERSFGATLTESFTQSQFMLGLMLRTW